MRWPGRKDPASGRRLPFEITPLPPDQRVPPASPDDQPEPAAAPPRPPVAPPVRTPAPPGPRRRPGPPRPDRSPLVATQIRSSTPSPAPHPDPPSPKPARPDLPDVLVRFDADAVPAALAFAGATAGATAGAAGWDQRRPSGHRCRVSRLDGSVWVSLDDQATAGPAAELVVALGGTVVRRRDGWPDGPSGAVPAPDDAALEPVPLLWLASTLMPAGPLRPLPEIAVVTTGRLAGPIVRRWQRSPAEVTISALSLEPIVPGDSPADAATWSAVLIRVTSRDGPLPQRAIAALTDLPHTVVCRVADRMLIDVRFMLPADDRQLVAEIPVGESWIAGGGEVGLWRIVSRGAEVMPPARVAFAVPSGTVPSRTIWPGAGLPGRAADTSMAPGGPVQVVPARRPDGRADAVLLDDLELDRLRRFLSLSPLAETAFIVPGPGRHLLTEPAGLLTAVPFGTPVCRIGPGGLYLEAGHELDPPVPSTARPELFQLDRDSIVVLCHDGACRLALSGMVPAWRLWLGEAPAPVGGISERGRQLLAVLAPAAPVPAAPSGQARDEGRAGQQLDRGRLLIEAERLEQRGELAGAARRLEEVGELYRAAVLYQRAAREAAGRG
jgi:hypothetical protein